jgi:hypothetical protein
LTSSPGSPGQRCGARSRTVASTCRRRKRK